MREFRKKQARLKKIMNVLVIVTAVYLFAYIGVEPMLAKALPDWAVLIFGYLCDALVIGSLVVLFVYYSKYSKSDKYLKSIEDELSDIGYYYTAREERVIPAYYTAVKEDLLNNSFAINEDVVINELEFDCVAMKRNEFFYTVTLEETDKNDVLAYLDSVIYDITVNNLKRRGSGVLLFITDSAKDDAVALSKMITAMGKKEQIKVALAIVELSTGRCYFLGNTPTKCQQMIANFAMNCDTPIKDKFKGEERLPFQDDLEEHMKEFNIKDFRNGTFYAH